MKRSFTLIELLIVIAIIAILAAMLLPALNKARDRAKTTDCINNLKGISLTSASYSNDFNDYVIVAQPRWSGDCWIRLFSEQYKVPDKTLVCPAAEDAWGFKSFYENPVPGANIQFIFSYGASKKTVGESLSQFRKLSFYLGKKARFSQMIQYGDCEADMYRKKNFQTGMTGMIEPGSYYPGTNTWGPVSLRHSSNGNFAMFDGHVTSMNRSKLEKDSQNVWRPYLNGSNWYLPL